MFLRSCHTNIVDKSALLDPASQRRVFEGLLAASGCIAIPGTDTTKAENKPDRSKRSVGDEEGRLRLWPGVLVQMSRRRGLGLPGENTDCSRRMLDCSCARESTSALVASPTPQ